MSRFFKHVQENAPLLKLPESEKHTAACIKKEDIQTWITQQDNTVFEHLAERASLWRLLHRAQIAHLNTCLQKNVSTDEEKNQRTCVLKETLWMAALLEELHLRLNEKRAAEPFRIEQHKLRHLLHSYDTNHLLPHDLIPHPEHQADALSDDIEEHHRWFTYNFDSTRLFSGHVLRICTGLLASPEIFGENYYFTSFYISLMRPILSFASLWVYLPRTFSNLFILTERFTDGNEKINLSSRWFAHCELNDRLFNLVNDSPSVIAAILAWFVLSGPSLALVVYITVLVKFAEVIFASTRAYAEAARFDAQREEHAALLAETPEDITYLEHLDACIAYDKGKFIACAAMHGVLLFCLAAFTPPVLALSPWVPFIAAPIAMLALCLRFPGFRDAQIPECPNDSLPDISTNAATNPPEKEPSVGYFDLSTWF